MNKGDASSSLHTDCSAAASGAAASRVDVKESNGREPTTIDVRAV